MLLMKYTLAAFWQNTKLIMTKPQSGLNMENKVQLHGREFIKRTATIFKMLQELGETWCAKLTREAQCPA